MNNENKLDKIAYKIFEVLAKFHMTCIMFIMVFIVLFVIACGGYKENNRVVLLVGIAVGVYVILCGIYYVVILLLYRTGVKKLRVGKQKGARIQGLIGSIMLMIPQILILCGILFGFYNDAPVTRVMGLVSIVECICSIVMFSLLLKISYADESKVCMGDFSHA